MSEGWFIGRGGERYGPYTEEQLREFARSGSLGAGDQVWVPATSSWRSAGEVPGLFAGAAGAAAGQPGAAPPPPPAFAATQGGELTGVGVGPRFVATLIDVVLLGVVGAILVAAFGDTTTATTTTDDGFEFGFELSGAPALIFMAGGFAYYWLLEALLGGTLGKLVTGLRVRMLDGSRVTLGAAAIRTVLRIIDGFAIYLVAAVVVWSSPKNQRIGDLAAKTVVVRA